jgi:hypothetical protein
MALSGTLNSSDYQGRFVQFSWDATQDTAKNESTITWTLKGAGDASASWYNSAPFYVAIGGEVVYEGGARVKLYKGTLVASGTKVIKHNSAGAASFAVSIKAAIYSASYNCSGSKTFTLNTIPRKATITSAPNFDDEDNPTIKYSNPAGNNVTSLRACISLDGSKDDIAYRNITKTGTSYTFTLTDAERKVLRAATTTANSRTVKFFIETVISGTTYRHSVSKTLSIVNAAPTLSPTVVDIKPETLALTGNKNILIRYHSNASFSFGSSVKKEATVKSRSLTSGTKSSSSGTGTFYGVDSGTFKFTLTDSRGNSASSTVTKNIIPYVDLTCALTPKAALAEDNTTTITLAMSGNYFNGSFGAVNNTLVVQYRHKVSGGDYGAWMNAGIVSTTNNKYVAKATISSLDYTQEYVVQARAIDKIATGGVATKGIVVRTKPVFDWSGEDFNFNVPVYYEGLCLSGAAKALSNTYTLDATATTAGTGWTKNSFTAVLIGNSLRCGFDATRSAATADGNVTNETVLNVSIKHSGKIKSMYSTSFCSGGTGAVATFAIVNAANDGTYLTFGINLAATGGALTQTTGQFLLPVILNLNNY